MILIGGLFFVWQKEPEQQASDQNQNVKSQEVEGMVTYEMPEYGIKIQIAPWQSRRVDTYDFIRAELKKKDQSLVWYEIPELYVKFLVTPDTKKDLRYKLTLADADEGIRGISVYYQSVADIAGCEVDGEIACSNLSLSSILLEKKSSYQSKKGRPFCGSMEESHLVGAYEFCVRYQNDFQLTSEQEKEYQEKHKDVFLGILPETLQSM